MLTHELIEKLPHRPPMVWVHEVVEATEIYGTCRILLDNKGHAWTKSGLRPSSLIEWMAQSFAYCEAAKTHGKVSRAFLAGIKDFEFKNLDALCKEKSVLVTTELVRNLAPLILLKGTVKGEGGLIFGTASLKVYAERIL